MGYSSCIGYETAKTDVMTSLKLRRKTFSSFLLIFCIWALGFLWFTGQIPQTRIEPAQNSADAIVVLTGGSGRLEYGLELLAENKAKTLFISGTGENVTVADIMRQASNTSHKKIHEKDIILGHQAENTIGNAQEIKDWLKNSNYKKIILVTSNYHIPRSLLELSTIMPKVYIIPAPVITDDNEMVFSEYNKYLASKLRHLFISVSKSK